MTSSVAAVWSHRSVLQLLVRRDLTVKYQQSMLGYFWSLIEPLAIAAIYWFVFGVLYDTKVSADGPPYPMFILTGIFAFQWLNSALGESGSIVLPLLHLALLTVAFTLLARVALRRFA